MEKTNKPAKAFDVDFIAMKNNASEAESTRDTTPVAGMLDVTSENNKPKEKRSEKVLIEVDPSRTIMWNYSDRTSSDDDIDISDLILSMAPGKKQILPALARKVSGIKGVDYELIYGRRRRVACLQLERKLIIELTDADDQACSLFMKQENADRKDITPMERAKSYYRQQKDGLYNSIREMAAKLEVSSSTMIRDVRVGELWFDKNLTNFLGSLKDLSIRLAEQLAVKKLDNPERFIAVIDELSNTSSIASKSNVEIKAKAIVSKLDGNMNEGITKTYRTEAGEVQVKINPKGVVTLKFRKEVLGLNKDKIFSLFEDISNQEI